MRYFSYVEYDEKDGVVVTMSEEEILDTYWWYWYDRMCAKFGKEHVDATYTKEDALTDWIVVNWAWEVDK